MVESAPNGWMSCSRICEVAQEAVKVFVPSDTTARSVGADAVAEAIRSTAAERGVKIDLVRNGSRGLYWLEPMVEVAVAGERRAYGPNLTRDGTDILAADLLAGGDNAKELHPRPH